MPTDFTPDLRVLGSSIFSELHEVGMNTSGACGDISRNVVGCPVAGIDPEEIIDGTPQTTYYGDTVTIRGANGYNATGQAAFILPTYDTVIVTFPGSSCAI